MKPTIIPLRNSMNRSPVRRGLLLIPLGIACVILSPKTQAVNPAPDGSYPGANTAEGNAALFSLTTGSNNTALGSEALSSVTTGVQNTATGAQALKNNTADGNTAAGFQALVKNSTGNRNTATGWRALFQNTLGIGNVAIGYNALSNVNGTGNIAIGDGAGVSHTTGDHNVYIANQGGNSESNTIRIGEEAAATFISGIYGVSEGGTIAQVTINSSGRLGTQLPMTSSRRFKKEIKPMDKASEAILALKPVKFHFKNDSKGVPQFGLIAEEVAEVNPDLVVRDDKGEIYTVRYDAVNAMLLNEFLKEHRKVQELEANAVRQQKQIEALAAGLRKVSAQFALQKQSARTVVSNP